MRRVVLSWLALVSGCSPPSHDTPPARSVEAPPAARFTDAQLPPIAELSPLEQAIAERMRLVVETAVEVQMWSADALVGHGSGVLVGPDGEVLTAAHVVHDAALHFRVVLPDGNARDAVVEARDEAHDAAVLHVSEASATFARVSGRPPSDGDWVVCAGYGGEVASDRALMQSVGVVVERMFPWAPGEHPKSEKATTYAPMLRLDCATAPGMSGGPVVDLDGDVIGIVVGSGGIASSVEAIRRLVPPAHPYALAASRVSRDSREVPTRDAAMFAALDAQRSVVELQVGEGPTFPAVIVNREGFVVAPAARLAKETSAGGATVAVADIVVTGRPAAHCDQIVAVRGELALLRISGLLSPEPGACDDLVPVAGPGSAVLGQIVAAVDGARESLGFVTAVDRHPGSCAPEPQERVGGCGTLRRRIADQFHRDFPPVRVTSALAHDGERPRYGSLVIDRSGRPVGIDVAIGAPGLTFAVPWTEALARFDEWLRP